MIPLAIVIFSGTTKSHPFTNPEKLRKLNADLTSKLNDSARIFTLIEIASLYLNVFNDPHAADSVSSIAVALAEKNSGPGVIIQAICGYIENNDLDTFHDKALKYAEKAVKLSEKLSNNFLSWKIIHCQSLIYLNQRKLQLCDAIRTGFTGMKIAYFEKRKSCLVLSYLDIGQSFDGLDLKKQALTYFLKATDLAESLLDNELLTKCYSRLSSFYFHNTLYEKSFFYKKKEFDLIKSVHPIDSNSYMWIVHDTLFLYSKLFNTNLTDLAQYKRLLDYTYRTENEKLREFTFALLRNQLIESDRIILLKNIYFEHYPLEFYKLSRNNPDIYLRVKAYLCEYERKNDSALFYFREAERVVAKSRNKFIKSTFYYRLGQFYKRQKQKQKAITNFLKAYEFAKSADNNASLPFMLSAIKPLELIYYELGEFEKAYRFARLHNDLIEKSRSIEKKEQVLMMDLTNAQQKRDIENLKEKQRSSEMLRKRQHERNLLAGGIAMFIVISFFLYRNVRKKKKFNITLNAEKKKSDDLLLNILPAETAEELKLTGQAKAKRMDSVTVMFTDFKNFTKASELMSAEELVQLVDYYFSEFDRIVSRHCIEKIKIIGDSYMCAGGIPTPNATHASDVVAAAMEMQQFIRKEQETSRVSGKPFFELRIGIHTGPVVAGVVGLNKFAYDIWGDTVNTASRMESSGEVNQVNISGATYNLIREKYHCRYRGKVTAKNKGEIDMYFVETAIL